MLKRFLALLLTVILLSGMSQGAAVFAEGSKSFNPENVKFSLIENPPQEQRDPNFADNRVIVKLAKASGIGLSGMPSTPDLGIGYSGMRLLNPSEKSKKTSGFSFMSVNSTQDNIYVIELDEPGIESVEEALEILNANPAVEIAEPVYFYETHVIPNDPQYSNQYALQKINAEQAWNVTTGSKNVVVGIIDSGIEGTHPDLVNNLWVNPNPNQDGYINDINGYNFTGRVGGTPTDSDGHGTHVAGIIGAQGNNSIGVAGTNWNVSLAWLGASTGGTQLSGEAIIEAINYANNHDIMILNNSYGGYDYSEITRQVIANYNGLFVVSAGNERNDNDGDFKTYPASYNCPNIISVAATDSSDNLASFSNFGASMVSISAPGDYVRSTHINGSYSYMSGTSMACPYVAGIAALIKAAHPTFAPSQLKGSILGTARKEAGLPVITGGIADASDAIAVNSFYTITYHLNDGTGASFTTHVPVGTGSSTIKPLDPVRSGYEFANWSLISSGGSAFVFGNIPTGNITLYAQWIQVDIETFADLFPNYDFREMILWIINDMDGGSRTDESIVGSTERAMMARLSGMQMEYYNMNSLKGIEYFTGLITLRCPNNGIKKADFSKNINLMTLDCSNNYLLKLDLSKNTSLVSLDCYDNQMGDDPDWSIPAWGNYFISAGYKTDSSSVSPFRYYPQRARDVDGNLNGDRMVDSGDLAVIFDNYGRKGFNLVGDINNDWQVDSADISMLLDNYAQEL